MNTLLIEHEVAEYKVCLLGASFDTGNLGVSALAESSIKVILNRWPEAKVTLLGSSGAIGERWHRIGGKDICIRELPIRFCKNIFLENHFLVLCLYALLFKMFRWDRFKRFCMRRNTSLKCINQMNIAADITGGDSFSDIYGMRRFLLGFLHKCLVLLFNKDLVMLPQTYGPFKKKITEKMAAHILKKAKAVYSRDKDGVQCARRLLGDKDADKVKLCPDVAFVLDAQPWDDRAIEQIVAAKDKGRQIIGLNVNGLLYNGGYTQNNMFGLAVDYPQLIKQIVDSFLAMDDVAIVLTPHVFPEDILAVENDSIACRAVYDSLTKEHQGNMILPEKQPDQGQIKYLIGKCDFFVGSRMHSCIAALSQSVPAVGLAYSKKFKGVFQTIGLQDFVVDLRSSSADHVLEKVSNAYGQRDIVEKDLKQVGRQTKEKVLSIFNEFIFEEN